MNSTIFDMYNVSLSRNTFDDHFDNALITLSYEIESLLCLLELEAIRDQPLDINFTAGDQIHGCRIATGSVANRASDVQVADARSCDGEDDILIRESVWSFGIAGMLTHLSSHACLHIGPALLGQMDSSLNARLSSSGLQHYVWPFA